MSDSCGHARRRLWPNSGLRAADEETIAAQRHRERCRECQAFFGEMEIVRAATRAAVVDEAMPVALRDQIYARVAEARVGRSRHRWSAALAIASIVAVMIVGGVTLLSQRSPVTPLIPVLAAEHAKAVGGDRLSSSDRREVEDWLSARVAFAVHVPEFSGARLSGARICLTEGGRGAVIEYAVGERTLSYFVLPAAPGAPPAGTGLMAAAESGYRMVLWRDTGLVHALVGALSDEELNRLARECIEQALLLARGGTLGLFTPS